MDRVDLECMVYLALSVCVCMHARLVCRCTVYCWRYRTLRRNFSKPQRRREKLCWSNTKPTHCSSITLCERKSGITGEETSRIKQSLEVM